ncbi:hypothetical protein MNB_SV-9-314 [hydrothermal vent metagenome]|uniref:TIGR02646 family protein n=1 Tax=hydrothermal vent metagenome TaxID=652676 RepID=A0A1W1BAV4_9ZZZZ
MKKVNKNDNIPLELKEYFNANPQKSWNAFKNECQTGYKEVLKEIKQNQGGVCCYCELTFYDEKGIRDDFRVEHFHPKSDNSNSKINWNLIWTNLLGCCHGGSDKTVLEKTRFICNKKHRHSDILKAEKNWDDEILNPLDIPAFPPIFKVSSKGIMSIEEENCKSISIDTIKAKNCLDEEKLNLNSIDLVKWRKAVFEKLEDEVEESFKITEDYEKAMLDTLDIYLSKDINGNFHSFFTTIRSYFEEDAEEFLRNNNYDG